MSKKFSFIYYTYLFYRFVVVKFNYFILILSSHAKFYVKYFLLRPKKKKEIIVVYKKYLTKKNNYSKLYTN